ncbi:hypothetical protein GGH12_003790 [Coemansia sp. RSA 1822]|nr:hypothetical protein GGF49_001778 [Coemansia sp. RSA 1853]KAJ2561703.1 hypothetical protein GGH12_003790 [Coemansia sp. RSA 1822]
MSVSSSVAREPVAGQSPSSALAGSEMNSESGKDGADSEDAASSEDDNDGADSDDSNDAADGEDDSEYGGDAAGSDPDSSSEEPAAKRTRAGEETVLTVEQGGQTYHVGDHVILEDPENASGTQGTELPAIAHIHGLRHANGATEATVLWYVHPQLTPHPAYMEFHADGILRTFRQTVVPVSRVRQRCYVQLASDEVAGHPREWREGDRRFVCEARFVDKGGFIQKIKHRGFWPDEMTEDRMQAIARPVPWADGPRQLVRAPVPVRGDDDASALHTRRSTRLATAPETVPEAVPEAAVPEAVQPPNGQMLAFQQMLAQQQAPFVMPGLAPATIGQLPGVMPTSPAGVMPLVPPRRRGRPPKNKQLIQKRAMEDAAAMAAAQQQQQQQLLQMQTTPRRPPMYAGRPPSSFAHSPATSFVHSSGLSAPMLARSSPAVIPQAPPVLRPQSPPRPVSIAYADAAVEPQLSSDVVRLFPTVNGRIKWYATAPVCQLPPPQMHHSTEYMRWKDQ